MKQISSVFHWQENYSSSLTLEEFTYQVSNITQANDCISVLKSVHTDNLNKLVSAHLNINSISNEFEFLSISKRQYSFLNDSGT